MIGNLDELRYEGGYPARAGRLCCASTGRSSPDSTSRGSPATSSSLTRALRFERYKLLPVWKKRLAAKTLVTTADSDVIYAF